MRTGPVALPCLAIHPKAHKSISKPIPLYACKVTAGFPSPADDFIERDLDLNEHLIRNPTATFLFRVWGDSMVNAGIHSNSVLIVDRSLKPADGNVVIAIINGEFIVRRIKFYKNDIWLIAENTQYKPIKIKTELEFEIWGVVIHAIHSFTSQ